MILMNGNILESKDSFDLVGITLEQDLNWHGQVSSIARSAAKKLDFCFEPANTSLPLTSIHCMSHKLDHAWSTAPTYGDRLHHQLLKSWIPFKKRLSGSLIILTYQE